MIFILNRVDQRGQDDIKIYQRIEQLQTEIQETLNLDNLPDIIPLSGRFLYYAQCAWGASAINGNSPVDADTRRNFLSGMLEDCSSLIRLHTSQDKKLKRWFRDLEDRLDDGESIDDESMRKVIYHVNNWSGGDRRKFWGELDKDYLLDKNWIKADDIAAIDKALMSDYSYPPTYKREWIDSQHNLLK